MEEFVCHRAITIIGPQSKVCCTGCTWPPTQNSASGKGEGQRKHSSPHNFQVSSHSCRYWWWLVISLWQIDFFINFFILLSLTRKKSVISAATCGTELPGWIDSFCEGSLPFLCSECATCCLQLCPTHLALLKVRIFPLYSHPCVLDTFETYHNSSFFFSRLRKPILVIPHLRVSPKVLINLLSLTVLSPVLWDPCSLRLERNHSQCGR